jgi:L-alanine-DL-glutamate epimerase-like enolase superfamily enzyme
VSLYERIAGIPVRIESYELERRELETPGFTRVTTVVRLRGDGEEGLGEDVTYDAAAHDAHPRLPLEGRWESLDALSGMLAAQTLFDPEPEQHAYLDYRRWAYESAALDLALRQAGRPFAGVLGREPRPLGFVISTRLPEHDPAGPVRAWREHYPSLRFKLDPTSDWDEALVSELAGTGAVASVDLKGQYRGTSVDLPPDARLYRLVAEAFPEAWLEDPNLDDPDAAAALEPHRDRITWDAPIHSVEDVDALPFPPRCLNVKPSRFGSLRRLLDFYDACEERGIALYGGGQWELGPGRRHIQLLGSLFHPDAPNDTAPGEYNAGGPRPGLPPPPLAPPPAEPGFR